MKSATDMISALGRLAGWIGARWKEAVVLIAVSALVAWISVEVDRAVRRTSESQTTALTRQIGRVATVDDLPDVTFPDQVTQYEAPDSSDTFTDCFQVSSWLVTSPSADSGPDTTTSTSASVQSADKGPSVPEVSTRPSWRKGRPGYGIIPMTSGRPRVSVGSDRVEVPVFNRSGALTRYEYDIPQRNNRLSLYTTAELLPGTVAAYTGLQYARTWRDVPLFSSATIQWHGGYGVSTQGVGPVGGVTLTADIRW